QQQRRRRPGRHHRADHGAPGQPHARDARQQPAAPPAGDWAGDPDRHGGPVRPPPSPPQHPPAPPGHPPPTPPPGRGPRQPTPSPPPPLPTNHRARRHGRHPHEPPGPPAHPTAGAPPLHPPPPRRGSGLGTPAAVGGGGSSYLPTGRPASARQGPRPSTPPEGR